MIFSFIPNVEIKIKTTDNFKNSAEAIEDEKRFKNLLNKIVGIKN